LENNHTDSRKTAQLEIKKNPGSEDSGFFFAIGVFLNHKISFVIQNKKSRF